MDLTKVILLLLVTFVGSSVQEEGPDDNEVVPPPVVQIANGKVQGLISSSSSGKTVYEFRGIPYGDFPKRFEESREYTQTWGEDVRDATEFGARCKQLNDFTKQISGEEDCLFLNVYSRNLERSAKLPVLVWIHGGHFAYGSGDTYNPEPLLDEDVVVVTINYRLGPLGFLNAGVATSPGNQGLKDMVLALKWVQKNIESFGGDKNLVTIFGESAGSASVTFLVLSPAARGLFSRAIAQCGTTNNMQYTLMQEPLKIAKKYAQEFDCPTSNPQYMVECLQRTDPDLLLKVINNTMDMPSFFETSQDIFFGGSVETITTPNAFLTQDPDKIQKDGAMNKVPLLLGVNKDEGGLFGSFLMTTTPSLIEKLNQKWESFLPRFLRYKEEAQYKCGYSVELWQTYFPGVDRVTSAQKQGYYDLFSDMMVTPGVRRTARFHSKASAPTYLYRFSLKGEQSLASYYGLPPDGDGLYVPTHGDDLPYFFEVPEFFASEGSTTERMKRDRARMVKLWVSFARDGSPTALWGDSLKNWPQFDSNDPKWVDIDDEEISEVDEEEIYGDRMNFWESFYEKIY